jgi:hypothetical protein
VAGADVIVTRLDVDDHAAEALRHTGRGLRRHVAAGIPHPPLPRLVRTLETVLVKVGLCALGQVSAPGVEAAMPSPLLEIFGNAGPLADPANTDIAP